MMRFTVYFPFAVTQGEPPIENCEHFKEILLGERQRENAKGTFEWELSSGTSPKGAIPTGKIQSPKAMGKSNRKCHVGKFKNMQSNGRTPLREAKRRTSNGENSNGKLPMETFQGDNFSGRLPIKGKGPMRELQKQRWKNCSGKIPYKNSNGTTPAGKPQHDFQWQRMEKCNGKILKFQ